MNVEKQCHTAVSGSNIASVTEFNRNTLRCQTTSQKFRKSEAIRIRRYTGKLIIQIGKDPLPAKQYLCVEHYVCHGTFLRRVEGEIGVPARTG